MRYITSSLFKCICALIICIASDAIAHEQSRARITIIEAQGNLASTHSLNCMALNGIKNQYTPADIYPAVADCLKKERYQDAADLYMIAGLYTYFDTLRVSDKSAHQAGKVLQINNLSGLDTVKKEMLHDKILAYKHKDASFLKVCRTARKIGAPDYYPDYMIQHGIKALKNDENESPLVPQFKPSEAFEKALTTYLQCPAN